MSVAVDITVPYRQGKAMVRMPYRRDNRAWLRDAVGTRRPEWSPDNKHWLIPRAAARRVFEAATADGRSATLTQVFKPDTEKCTEQCRTAKLDTVDDCTCICGGANHGQSSPGWKKAGGYLLVRAGKGGFITRTLSNGIT
jgi:hypothetical protein